MKKAAAFILFLLMSTMIFAQYDEEEPELPPDANEYTQDLYSSGDQCFVISAGVIFPVLFTNNGDIISNKMAVVGGYGSLSYQYFLGAHFFLGGEISGSFISTQQKNNVYLIPIGIRVGYQFLIWRFEIPLTYTIGVNWHTYVGYNNFSLYMRAGASLFYRFNPDWSYGINTSWCWFPEWTGDTAKNVDGHMIELTLSVRYHF